MGTLPPTRRLGLYPAGIGLEDRSEFDPLSGLGKVNAGPDAIGKVSRYSLLGDTIKLIMLEARDGVKARSRLVNRVAGHSYTEIE